MEGLVVSKHLALMLFSLDENGDKAPHTKGNTEGRRYGKYHMVNGASNGDCFWLVRIKSFLTTTPLCFPIVDLPAPIIFPRHHHSNKDMERLGNLWPWIEAR